ncbi:MAG: serine protease [Candidatus Omnitrophica bacterium]|nr:serine protease [Candidatus Omnitrophota bacterium]
MKKVKWALAVVFLLVLLVHPVYGEINIKSKTGNLMASPLEELKKTVVFLGRISPDGKPRILATGFLVNVRGTYHLLTAKHVIMNHATGHFLDKDLLAFFNLKSGGVTVRSIAEIKDRFNIEWVFHSDSTVDIAIIPFMLDPAEDDVRVVSDNLFLDTKHLHELYDVFFLSYQPGIEPKGCIDPIVRTGTISLLKGDKSFYIDASAFPGNTGSPVFLRPSPIRFRGQGFTIGDDPLGGKFIGIIGEYLPYQEIAVSSQTGRPRIVFEENTGLSRVWSASFIQEIIDSEPFKKQLKKVSGK